MNTPFSGVLLKPLDQQGDRDGNHIDPAGVQFDPDEDYPIWRNFNYVVPDDVLGKGKVSLDAETGAMVVTGELRGDWLNEISHDRFPWKLAIGVAAVKTGLDTIEHSTLITIALTAEHQDPTQPDITIRRRPMNLVRLGHYHTPTNADDSGFCQTALVVKVDSEDDTVNLVVWDSDGDQDRRLDVLVSEPLATKATFHLSGDCPWSR